METPEPKSSKSALRLILGGIVVTVLIAGLSIGGTYWFIRSGRNSPVERVTRADILRASQQHHMTATQIQTLLREHRLLATIGPAPAESEQPGEPRINQADLDQIAANQRQAGSGSGEGESTSKGPTFASILANGAPGELYSGETAPKPTKGSEPIIGHWTAMLSGRTVPAIFAEQWKGSIGGEKLDWQHISPEIYVITYFDTGTTEYWRVSALDETSINVDRGKSRHGPFGEGFTLTRN